MKKAIIGIFISFGAIFLMSHNTSAIDVTFNLNDYEKQNFDVSQNYYDYKIYKGNGTLDHQCLATYNCTIGNNQQLRVAATHDSFPLKTGDIIVYNLALYSPAWLHHIDDLQFRALAPGYGLSTLYFHEVSDFSAQGDITESFPTGSNSAILGAPGYFVSNIYEVALIATADGNRQLGSYNQNTVDIAVNMGDSSSGDVLVVAVTGFTVYRYKGSSVNKEQSEATQNAVDDSESSSSDSQSSSQGATSNLLSVFTGFANVITNASATNCVIDAPLNTSFSSDRLDVDLCGLSLPPAIGALTSIIAVMVVVPFAISMFNKFIGIMEGFQR